MLVSKIRIEGPIVKEVTRSGHGGHVIVPDHWVGKTVRVTIIGERQQTVEVAKASRPKRHVRGAARLAKKNVNLSEPADK